MAFFGVEHRFLNKRRAVCRRERLHVTVFGETAILSPERALNCTNELYSDEVGFLRRFLEGLIDHVVAIG